MVERQRAVGSLEGLEESSCQEGLVLLVWPTCVSQCLPFPWRHLLQVGGEAVVCPRAASAHNNHALHLRRTFSATDLRQREETGPPLQGGVRHVPGMNTHLGGSQWRAQVWRLS